MIRYLLLMVLIVCVTISFGWREALPAWDVAIILGLGVCYGAAAARVIAEPSLRRYRKLTQIGAAAIHAREQGPAWTPELEAAVVDAATYYEKIVIKKG